jgi:hypothetical protein
MTYLHNCSNSASVVLSTALALNSLISVCSFVFHAFFILTARVHCLQIYTSPVLCNVKDELHLFIDSLFFFNSHSGGWSPSWFHSARRPLNGLLYLPRVIMMMEKLVEWRLAGETEVLGENLPQRHFVHHKSHLTRPGLEPGPPRREASD